MATTATPRVPVRSMQDILTALDQHPEWRAALRERLLSRELIELPAMFAKFAAETTRRLDLLTAEVEQLKTDVATLKSNVDKLDGKVDRLDDRVGKLDDRVDKLDDRVDKLDGKVDRLDDRVGKLDGKVDKLDGKVDKLTNSVGELKGAHAEAAARENIELIADDLGLQYRRTVPRIELRRLARDNGADVHSDEIKSFVNTDIIAEASDAHGETIYIAVEASYTAERHDTDRAVRHAALMQKFTGKPCRAAIASARNSDRIQPLVASGQVAWHEIQVRIQPAT